MEITVKVEISPALKRLFENPVAAMEAARRAGMIMLVEKIEALAKKEAPVRTSNLMNRITSHVSPDGLKGEINSQAPYSVYVHRGTGLFGPYHQLIRPKTKKALSWPGALHPVKSVKGQKPNPFMTRALARINFGQTFEAGVFGYLRKFGVV
jgi:hypothetical protein